MVLRLRVEAAGGHQAAGIHVIDGVVEGVAVVMQAARIIGRAYHRVGLEESSGGGIVSAGAEEKLATGGVLFLAGKTIS